MKTRLLYISFLFSLLFVSVPTPILAQKEMDASKLVQEAIDHWRGVTSFMKSEMVIHREDYERKTALESLTKGEEDSLVRFTYPPKDAGSATLTKDEDMWSYSPKTNRVISIPPSMKTRSWMGSDFSYQDLSRGDDIIDHYQHKLLKNEEHEGKKVYVIEAFPLEDAPVVWGKEVLKIREDYVIIEHNFYDQDFRLIKKLRALEIGDLGGRIYATRLRMEKIENKGEWTEVRHKEAAFNIEVKDSAFTLSNLQNPRGRLYSK